MTQRIMLGFAAAALTCSPAFAQHSTTGQTPSSTPTPSAVKSCFNTLAGEWDGQVTTHNGTKASSSLINASNHVENDGAQLASCFQGYSFGQPFQGGCVFSSQNNAFNFASTDSMNNEPARGSFKSLSNGTGFVYSFERADPRSGKTTRFEQVTTITNNDSYSVQCWSFDNNGKKHEVMCMDMTRLPSGQTSDAAANFNSSPTLAKARQTLANTAQATADDTK